MSSTRKLAAILSADVYGYSRMMGEDDQATVEALNACKGTMRALVAEHGGRVVDSPGDEMLAEFPSAVEAVKAAMEIQGKFSESNAMRPESRKMRWRIGINLGDVMEENGALYGDGVNIAARLPSPWCSLSSAYGNTVTEWSRHPQSPQTWPIRYLPCPLDLPWRCYLSPT
jgi:adenylate cyclase